MAGTRMQSRFCFIKPRLRVIVLILICFLAVNTLVFWLRGPENSTNLISTMVELKEGHTVQLVQTQQRINKSVSLGDNLKHKIVENSTKDFEEVVTLELVNQTKFESQFHIVDSVSSIPTDSNAQYVVVIPRRININSMRFNANDQRSAIMAGSTLDALNSLDGVACLPRKMKTKKLNKHPSFFNQTWKSLFNTSWCNFARREWSIQIRNSGEMRQLEVRSTDGLRANYSQYTMFQLCNIINGPFVVRKEKFMELKGLRPNFGRLSLLDFFLRSNGKLKIGKFGNCFFSDDLFYVDRGSLEGSDDFPEYSDFGVHHNVLRIIMEDRIEWTKCVATSKHCKEQPYVPPSTLPQAGQPICCSVLLGKMLRDVVAVFTKANIDYRLIYGTLLGAMRSGAIIPYSHDIDFAVEYNISHNSIRYDALQKYFYDKYYISSNSFMGVPRMIPLIPVHLNIKTSQFFNGEFDVQGDKFFSPEILNSIQGLLPVSGTYWRTRCYVDFYPGWDLWWNNSASTTFIDGVEYRTVKEKEYEVALWYGKNWKTPILQGDYNSQSDLGAVVG